MKLSMIGLLFIVLFSACNGTNSGSGNQSADQNDGKHFGKTIDEEGAIDINQLFTSMEGKESMNAKVSGNVNGVCKVKGCWMTLAGGESDMRVTFKDYSFFVPKDIDDNRTVIVEGIANRDTTSVEMLRHFAEDEGADAETIERITEPEIEIVFEAEGVYIP